ncbi:MAG TPA: acetolactate synthase large subunit [Cytophagales bacterium]|jgi:acetolactate synthase-1/2/3 large subunit|nr:acetolactate synthase large subunit [Cytophagales bacterium]
MKKTGANLVVHALEQIGVRYTFGIPGVHNTEIYDELNNSEQITPVLVTHECGASFMADGLSRTSDTIGALVIVPAAGTTHAMSGIGEAYLDGIPMLIISGGVRRDTGRKYQLHQLDQEKLLKHIVKKYFLVRRHDQILQTIYEAYHVATSGEPGPVFVEVPAEIQLFRGEVNDLPPFVRNTTITDIDNIAIHQAVRFLVEAKKPGIFVGWGAVDATEEVKRIAEHLSAPVATTLQGLSAFPADHPLHTGVGFGPASVPASQKAFADCDCLLAVGTRFGELATGSYGVTVPENLVHIDINNEVFNKNYKAKVAIEGDATLILSKMVEELDRHKLTLSKERLALPDKIADQKARYFKEWSKQKNDKVTPGHFFKSLRTYLPEDAYVLTDDGKHTFLTAELFPTYKSRHFISPTDFNCMGYCVPASIGVKFSHPDHHVAAIVGDGAFMMTGMELLTANTYGIGIVAFVFNDGELGQISQFQKIPLNRKTCTVLGKVKIEGIATATGSRYLNMENDLEVEKVIEEAYQSATEGQSVIVDVNIDYSKKTFLTKGVVKTNLGRFPLSEKVRFIGRALKRRIKG